LRVKGQWSILAGQPNVPGIIFRKPFVECSEDEIHQELIAQMMQNQDFMCNFYKYNRVKFSEKFIIRWSPIWPEFHQKKGKWEADFTKFSNNAGTLKLRPSCETPLRNCVMATAYTKEAVEIFSMEGACRSGIFAANIIDKNCKMSYFQPRSFPSLFPLRALDSVAFAAGAPNIMPIVIIGIALLFVILTYGLIANWDKQSGYLWRLAIIFAASILAAWIFSMYFAQRFHRKMRGY
jgi:hypothetical protein